MLERWLVLGGFFALLASSTVGWRWYWSRRTRQLARSSRPAALTALIADASPAVLYFTTPQCAQCRLQQSPALEQVKASRPDLKVVKLNALERPDLARYYQVMTVPTTIVLDRQGRPVAINHGLTSAARLLQQVKSAAANLDT